MTEIELLATIRETGFVARDTWTGTSVSRASVSKCPYEGAVVTLTAWDGITHQCEANMYRTLAQQLAGYRPATPQEIAAYERLERPAPHNWE